MLDLSTEPLDWNIATCQKYLRRMAKINCLLEMELGTYTFKTLYPSLTDLRVYWHYISSMNIVSCSIQTSDVYMYMI